MKKKLFYSIDTHKGPLMLFNKKNYNCYHIFYTGYAKTLSWAPDTRCLNSYSHHSKKCYYPQIIEEEMET